MRDMMRSLRWRGRRDLVVEQVPVPSPDDDEALIHVLWTGICGSDLEEYLEGPVVIRGPVTLGHEIVGRVVRAARDGSGPAEGQIVVVDVVTGCGACFWCLSHEEGLCPSLVVKGQHEDGGLAERLVARADRLIPVPEGLGAREAALAEPTAVAVRAARKFGPIDRRGGLVVGGGTIGLLVAQVLRHEGAERVVIVEPDADRAAVATGLGFDVVWADSPSDRAARVAALFPDRGVDLVAECSGAPGAAAEAIALARAGGIVVLLSVTPGTTPIGTTEVVLREKTIHGSAAHMWDTDVAPAVALIASGAIDVKPLITAVVPLTDGAGAFELLADRTVSNIKILVRIGEE
ncbi:zinc-binding dehydrogenase [Microbacterium insulae]|uniref:Zinc-binding dehydrogenase n=1 Tax=Microbacterium insulae TaxID=483014 RepID=A0ABW3AH53_9MICO